MKKNDGFLMIACILIALAAWLLMKSPPKSETGGTVHIYQGGMEVYSGPLVNDNKVIIDTNGHLNAVQIKDGKAYMVEADCPDQICVHTRPAEREGQSIVCLPNQVVVEVRNAQKNEMDGVSE